MKRLCLPLTARPHLSRQKLLIKELRKRFDLELFSPEERRGDMIGSALLYAIEFNNFLNGKEFDAIIIRGDRYEMLGLAMTAVYKGFKLIHIEGGDESGVIDNRVRHAITHLSEYHFCTNEESHKRLISMGVSPEKVWNMGSLDVEFAQRVREKEIIKNPPYILVAHHPIEGEDEREIDLALEHFKEYGIIKIGSNTDYGRSYGEEQYSPEDYINLLRYASVAIGNSSSLLKEASILEVPVVLIGERQMKRLSPQNVLNVPCTKEKIQKAITYQLNSIYPKDLTYYQQNTSKKIARKLTAIL